MRQRGVKESSGGVVASLEFCIFGDMKEMRRLFGEFFSPTILRSGIVFVDN